MSEHRLDELVETLGRTRPVLDDIARARIAATIHAACDRAPAHRRGARTRWLGGIAAALALGAALALRARPAGPTAPVPPAAAAVRLADGIPLLATRDATVTGEFAQATVTLYGRGWATHQGNRLTVEADAFVVDRKTGDAPIEIAARGATIQLLRATFVAASASELRVTVIRGELALRCPGAETTRVVAVQQDARCEPPRTAPASPGAPRGPAPSPPVRREPSPVA